MWIVEQLSSRTFYHYLSFWSTLLVKMCPIFDGSASNHFTRYQKILWVCLWNNLLIKDINLDGQLDILAGNAGSNFKWKPSIEKPVKLYLDDFDKNLQLDPIIFYDFFGKYVPFSSKDNLDKQLPEGV